MTAWFLFVWHCVGYPIPTCGWVALDAPFYTQADCDDEAAFRDLTGKHMCIELPLVRE